MEWKYVQRSIVEGRLWMLGDSQSWSLVKSRVNWAFTYHRRRRSRRCAAHAIAIMLAMSRGSDGNNGRDPPRIVKMRKWRDSIEERGGPGVLPGRRRP